MIDWLLKLDPREAQLEALSRSYLGIATRDKLSDTPNPRPVPRHPRDRPAVGWGHFLEQRVGKTPTLLNEWMLLRRDYGVKWAIVLAPNAFKRDWPLEVEKFGVDAPAIAFESTKREQTAKFIAKNEQHGGLISVNYEALIQKPTVDLLRGITGSRCLVAADEGITLKNPSSGTTKAALSLGQLCPIRRDLSGKPLSQGPEDLYAQLRFLGLLEGVTSTVFKGKYCQRGGFMGKKTTGVKNEDELHALLERCSWTARKLDWIRPPPGHDRFKDYPPIRMLEMTDRQHQLYVAMFKDMLMEIEEGIIISADQVITKLIKLQQISSGFVIDEFRETHELVPIDKNPLILEIERMLLDEICLEREGGKVIINCTSKYMIDALEHRLARWQPAVIRGQLWHKETDRDIIAEKARFNGDPNCRLMIGQEQALRYGHTLMGTQDQPCLNMIYAENSYSLNDRSQTEERAQGAGQLAPVAIWDFAVSPQMARIIEALQDKEDIVSVVMRFPRSTGVLPRGFMEELTDDRA